jgi:hypothetical protein
LYILTFHSVSPKRVTFPSQSLSSIHCRHLTIGIHLPGYLFKPPPTIHPISNFSSTYLSSEVPPQLHIAPFTSIHASRLTTLVADCSSTAILRHNPFLNDSAYLHNSYDITQANYACYRSPPTTELHKHIPSKPITFDLTSIHCCL